MVEANAQAATPREVPANVPKEEARREEEEEEVEAALSAEEVEEALQPDKLSECTKHLKTISVRTIMEDMTNTSRSRRSQAVPFKRVSFSLLLLLIRNICISRNECVAIRHQAQNRISEEC